MLRERLAAQLLSGPRARTPGEVAGRLLAVQAQDLRAARLSVRSRSEGLRASDVDRALDSRELVVDWLQRGTLHLVRAEDHGWLHPLVTPPLLVANARRLAQEGVPPEDAERGVAAVVRALGDGPLRRAELRAHVASAGVRTQGQALVHVLFLASLRGHVLRGPVVAGEQAFVQARDWLGPREPAVDRGRALARLARRYLEGHAPATDRDLARWSGLPLGDARAGLRALGDTVHEGQDGLLRLSTEPEVPPLPPPRLLGGFEPVLLGWVSRDEVVGPHRGLVTSNGIFRPFAMVGGRAVATWGLPAGRVTLDPLEPVPEHDLAALAADAIDVQRFLCG